MTSVMQLARVTQSHTLTVRVKLWSITYHGISFLLRAYSSQLTTVWPTLLCYHTLLHGSQSHEMSGRATTLPSTPSCRVCCPVNHSVHGNTHRSRVSTSRALKVSLGHPCCGFKTAITTQPYPATHSSPDSIQICPCFPTLNI